VTIPWLTVGDPFPPVESALRDPDGLLAAGDDLSPERLLDAYRKGIFPWFGGDDPVLWWSPNPRAVLWLRDLHVSRSLRRTIRSAGYRVTVDTAFSRVVAACAEPRDADGGTWITAAMAESYGGLASLGYAHSVEVWSDSFLIGGLYGVTLGRMFYGESMFSRRPGASKIALVYLARQLEVWGFEVIDCQVSTTHFESLGASAIPRTVFVQAVDRLVRLPAVPSPWTLAPGLPETVRVR
jgi:leucyl/phenylalanyl-tRNA--protein transferase